MPGEVLGLVGDNGAGKTTLVKCIAGVHRADAGEIHIDGELRRNLDADSARSLGIETVHQNLSLVDTLDVAQNFFLNRELVYGKWAHARSPGRTGARCTATRARSSRGSAST